VGTPRSGDGTAFRFRAGRWSLDLCSTLLWRHVGPVELLEQPEDLARWLVAAGLLDEPVAAGPAELGDAVSLREAAYRLFRQNMAGAPLDAVDIAVVNRIAARVGRYPQITPNGTVVWKAEAPLEAGLAAVAADCVELLGGPDARRLRECASDNCAFLFVDTSRPGTRRWCAQNRCGNRQHVRDHRARRRSAR
jgi:predicted RNA-binding Zn ribbon-like protein